MLYRHMTPARRASYMRCKRARNVLNIFIRMSRLLVAGGREGRRPGLVDGLDDGGQGGQLGVDQLDLTDVQGTVPGQFIEHVDTYLLFIICHFVHVTPY